MHTKTRRTKSLYAKESKQKRFFSKKKYFCKFAATYQATCLVTIKAYFMNMSTKYLSNTGNEIPHSRICQTNKQCHFPGFVPHRLSNGIRLCSKNYQDLGIEDVSNALLRMGCLLGSLKYYLKSSDKF